MKTKKETHTCELCHKSVNLKKGKEDYLLVDINNLELWVHTNCLASAKELLSFEWSKDY